MRLCSVISAVFLAASAVACEAEVAPTGPVKATEAEADALVGYDVRLLRPADEALATVVDRLVTRAGADGKRVVVLFSADWCHRCKRLDAELGNTAPSSQIGDVQILMVKEEDWEAATRLDEFKQLRVRWEPVVGTFPLMVLLGPDGGRVEEMKEAKERLEAAGLDPTLANWFESSRGEPSENRAPQAPGRPG